DGGLSPAAFQLTGDVRSSQPPLCPDAAAHAARAATIASFPASAGALSATILQRAPPSLRNRITLAARAASSGASVAVLSPRERPLARAVVYHWLPERSLHRDGRRWPAAGAE